MWVWASWCSIVPAVGTARRHPDADGITVCIRSGRPGGDAHGGARGPVGIGPRDGSFAQGPQRADTHRFAVSRGPIHYTSAINAWPPLYGASYTKRMAARAGARRGVHVFFAGHAGQLYWTLRFSRHSRWFVAFTGNVSGEMTCGFGGWVSIVSSWIIQGDETAGRGRAILGKEPVHRGSLRLPTNLI